MSALIAPCFVGGTGRSGTTILGRLIGHHRAYGLVPVEAKFHATPSAKVKASTGTPPSLLDLLHRYVTLGAFVTALRTHWYSFKVFGRQPRGLDRFVPQDVFAAAVAAFEHAYSGDPWRAAGDLMQALFSVVAPPSGSWVEMSPPNIRSAKALVRCLPQAHFIHIVRDGRDVASSMVTRPWGRSDWSGALEAWQVSLRRAEGASSALGAERVLVVHLEDLVSRSRDATYRAILDFLHVEDDPAMRTFFATQMDADRAHSDRWRDGLAASEIDRRDAEYRRCLERLADERPDGIGSQLLAHLDA